MFVFEVNSVPFPSPPTRELKRLESLSRSPLLSHLGESVGGACVVRAYGQERRFQQVFLHRLDTHLAAFILLHAGNRWLGICLVRGHNDEH